MRALLIALVSIAIAAAGIALLAAARGDGEDDCAGFRLTAREWRGTTISRADGGPSSRQLLAQRIVACGVIEGWSQRRVRGTLGRPTLSIPRDWAYVTGRDAIGDDTLMEMTFRRDGRVASVEHNLP